MHTWRLADELESEVLRLVRESPAARQDLRYRSPLEAAVSAVPSHVAEGFARRSPGDFCRFLDYALSSLAETEVWLRSGLKRQHFTPARCQPLFLLTRRTRAAAIRLRQSQERYRDNHPRKRPPTRR